MRRVAIAFVAILLVLVIVLGAAVVIWKVRSLTRPQAEYLVRQELALSSGFGGARVVHVMSGWNTARAKTSLLFGIRDFKTNSVNAVVEFVRVDGGWRVLRIEANGRIYASLMDLSNEQMAGLRMEYAAHVTEVTFRTGQAAGEAVVEFGKQLGDAIAETWQEMTQR